MKQLTILLLSLLTIASHGQYLVRGSLGISFNPGIRNLTPEYMNTSWDQLNSTASWSNAKGSFGSGYSLNAALGYAFSNWLDAEVGFTYHGSYTYEISEYRYTTSGTTQTDVTLSSRTFSFAPAVKLKAPFENSVPYVRAGIPVAFPTISINRFTRSTTGDPTVNTEYEQGGNAAYGLCLALGIDFNFSDQGTLFIEAFFQAMQYAPSEKIIKAHSVGGQDRIDDLSTAERETLYMDSHTYTTGFDPSVPSFVPKIYLPFQAVGLAFGYQHKFGQ